MGGSGREAAEGEAAAYKEHFGEKWRSACFSQRVVLRWHGAIRGVCEERGRCGQRYSSNRGDCRVWSTASTFGTLDL